MQSSEAVLTQARAVLANLPYHGQQIHPTIQMRLSDGALILEGQVNHIGDKTRAAARMRKIDGVSQVIDHLRVANGTSEAGDGELRNAVCERLLQTVEFRGCQICVRAKGRTETVREAVGEKTGWIEIGTSDGCVTLRGHVISLSHMRMAGVLAWWSPGCQCVVNELDIAPDERDNDEEISEALRLVLEADPLLDADQIAIRTENRVVTLEGYAADHARKRAEQDAWYIAGVEDVVNRIATPTSS